MSCQPSTLWSPADVGRVAVLGAGLVVATGCQPPTQVSLELSTDVPCNELAETSITLGVLGGLATKDPATVTSLCSGGTIGSLIVVPIESDEAELAFQIVSSTNGKAADTCTSEATYDDRCIIARRALRFIPNTPLRVPIAMRASCAGVLCPDTDTCVEGQCAPAAVDAGACATEAGCGEGNLGPRTDPIPSGPADGWSLGIPLASAEGLAASATQVFVVGRLSEGADFGSGPTGLNSAAYLASWTSNDGAHLWATPLAPESTNSDAVALAVGSAGNVYSTGTFVDNVLYDGHAHEFDSGWFVTNHDDMGNLVWHAVFVGGAPQDIAVDASGQVYVVGTFGTSLADDGADVLFEAEGDSDGFIIALKSNPTHEEGVERLWQAAIHGSGANAASHVAATSEGAVVMGTFDDELAVGDGNALTPPSMGIARVFRAEFTQQGMNTLLIGYGGGTRQTVLDLTVTPDGQRCFAGEYRGNFESFTQDGEMDALYYLCTPLLGELGGFGANGAVVSSLLLAADPERDGLASVRVSSGIAIDRLTLNPVAPHSSKTLSMGAEDVVTGLAVVGNSDFIAGYTQQSSDFGFGPLGEGDAPIMFLARLRVEAP